MARLTQEQIKNCRDLKTKIVEMPEWGGDIEIKAMSVKQQLDIDANKEDKDLVFILIQMCCIDIDGGMLFDDIKVLQDKSPESIMKLYKEVLDINKQNPADVEDMAKNS